MGGIKRMYGDEKINNIGIQEEEIGMVIFPVYAWLILVVR
jgi:hypothetical protein